MLNNYLLWWNAGICPVWNSVKNCFPTYSFTEIGQSATELWLKTIFSMAAVRYFECLIFLNFIFGHVTVVRFQMCCCVPNFIVMDDFFMRYGYLTIFKMADVRRLELYVSKNGLFETPMEDFLLVVDRGQALNCLIFEKNCIYVSAFRLQTDRRTNERTDKSNA